MAKTPIFAPGSTKLATARLHAGAAGAGDDHGELVLRAEAGLQPVADLLVDLEEVGVEVPDDGLSHGLIDARMDRRGSGTKQEALRRREDGESSSH